MSCASRRDTSAHPARRMSLARTTYAKTQPHRDVLGRSRRRHTSTTLVQDSPRETAVGQTDFLAEIQKGLLIIHPRIRQKAFAKDNNNKVRITPKGGEISLQPSTSPDAPHDSFSLVFHDEKMLYFLPAWHDTRDISLAFPLSAPPCPVN